jgi:hypothetical protein
MAKKKTVKKKKMTAPALKDFEIVAHTIPVKGDVHLSGDYRNNKVLAVYLNRYGIEIGYLLLEEEKNLWSMDPVIYEEYLESVSDR